jgi:cell division protein FtsZ
LNDNDIVGAQNILLYISSGSEEISMDEVSEITEYIQQAAGLTAEIIWGNGNDESLGDKISVTLIATGFKTSIDSASSDYELKRTVVSLDKKQEVPSPKENIVAIVEDEMKLIIKNPEITEIESTNIYSTEEHTPVSTPMQSEQEIKVELSIPKRENEMYVFTKTEEKTDEPTVQDSTPIFEPLNENVQKNQNIPIKSLPNEESNLLDQKHSERVDRLKKLSLQIKNQEGLAHLEKVPAYLRRNVTLDDTTPSSESEMSTLSLNNEDSTQTEFKKNPYLHDNVD